MTYSHLRTLRESRCSLSALNLGKNKEFGVAGSKEIFNHHWVVIVLSFDHSDIELSKT